MAEFRRFRIETEGVSTSERRLLPDPAGYDGTVHREQGSEMSAATARATQASRQAALFTQAQAPLKQVGMLAFMMWMTGTQLHLFSIMMTMSGIYQPLSAILKSREAFPEDPDRKLNTTLPRLLYCAINAGGLAFAAYRLNKMGLVPLDVSDWVSYIQVPRVAERLLHSVL